MKSKILQLLAILLPISIMSYDVYATDKIAPYVQVEHPEWSKNATIYEVNIRQYTPEGTFKAFEAHLPRLKAMGVDILWLMPIHPIGEKNRKGKLGSYYSVKDYYGINPEFGSPEDFKRLVKKIHGMGMYVIIDWVANHSSWDNPLVEKHPDWYSRDYKGDFQPTPWYDWSDVIDFDFNHPALRQYMREVMKYWVKEFDIDGFRCDVAGFVPVDFWERVRSELDAIKPVFMLAEWESRDLHRRAFDMSYAWKLHDAMQESKEENSVIPLYSYFAHNENAFPENAYRMNFVDNHDKNSWEGTMFERFGDALEASIVLTVMAEGMPLIHTGQEAGLDRALAFFEKDLVQWRPHPLGQLYKTLFAIKKQEKALWNGRWGSPMIPVPNSHVTSVFAFVRGEGADRVFTVLNYSNEKKKVSFEQPAHLGSYKDAFSGSPQRFSEETSITMEPYGYRVFLAE